MNFKFRLNVKFCVRIIVANTTLCRLRLRSRRNRRTEEKEALIVESVVINVRRHPRATSVEPLLLSLSLFSPLSLTQSSLFVLSFSFSLHPASAPSVSFPLIIPYLYLGPFGSQWRYLACSDWVETPPNLITQSVGRGAKEVAMAVSLHTACTFRSTSLGNSLCISFSCHLPSSYSHFHSLSSFSSPCPSPPLLPPKQALTLRD